MSPDVTEPTREAAYGHCYVVDGKAGCGYVDDVETFLHYDGEPAFQETQRCGGLLSHHEAEHFHRPSIDEAFTVIRDALGMAETPNAKAACSCQSYPGVGYPHRDWCTEPREQAYAEERAEYRTHHPEAVR